MPLAREVAIRVTNEKLECAGSADPTPGIRKQITVDYLTEDSRPTKRREQKEQSHLDFRADVKFAMWGGYTYVHEPRIMMKILEAIYWRTQWSRPGPRPHEDSPDLRYTPQPRY